MPPMTPVSASTLSPAGSVPDETVHATLPSVPLTLGVSRYGTPTCAAPASGIVITNGGASIVSVSAADIRLPVNSVSYTSTMIRPASTADGVPKIVAVAGSNVTPAGSAALTRFHAHDPIA